MFKGIADLASMMRMAPQMMGKMQESKEKLKSQRVTGTAGGGLVEVDMNGLGEVLKLRIDPSLMKNADREMIEDLIPAAVNQAQAKAKQLHVESMQSMTEGMNLPGLDEALSQFTGPSTET